MKAGIKKRLKTLEVQREAAAARGRAVTFAVVNDVRHKTTRVWLRDGSELRGEEAERALRESRLPNTGGVVALAGVDADLALGLVPHPDPNMRPDVVPDLPGSPSTVLAGQEDAPTEGEQVEGLPQGVGGDQGDLTAEETAILEAYEPVTPQPEPHQPVEVSESEPAAGEEPLDVESFFPALPSGLGWRE